MDFFQIFSKTYNTVCEKDKFAKIIPPSDEKWNLFSKSLPDFSIDKREYIYLSIIHYYYLHSKKLEELPYDIKFKNGELIIPYSNLPSLLQHIILNL
jgi:hypothetical protein